MKESQLSPMRWDGLMTYLPLIVGGGLFAFTIFWSFFGPIDYGISNAPTLYAFLLTCLGFLVAGYLLYVRTAKSKKTTPTKIKIDVNRVVILSGVVSIPVILLESWLTTGNLFPDVWFGLSNAGKAYAQAKSVGSETIAWFFYLKIALAPISALAAPLSIFLYSRLKKFPRYVGLSSLVLSLFLGIAQGTNSKFAEITSFFCLYMFLLAVAYLRDRKPLKFLISLTAIFLSISAFFGYYKLSIESRLVNQAISSDIEEESGSDIEEESGALSNGSKQPFETSTNKELLVTKSATGSGGMTRPNLMFDNLPSSLKPITLMGTMYLTHGYKGLSLALEQKFTSTHGLGFSDFFRHNFVKLSGQNEETIVQQTYMGKLTTLGWPIGLFWGSFFIYPASDIGFAGTIVLVGLIGFGLAATWRDYLINRSPFATALFIWIFLLISYFSANNRIFQGGEGFVSFVSVLFIWLAFKIIKKPISA